MFLADFHLHTNMSDGRIPLPELIDLFGERGFGAIAVTDHLCEQTTVLGRASRYLGLSLNPERFPRYVELVQEQAERAWKKYRMVVLPGFEITKNTLSNHRSAHVLAVGLTKFVEPSQDIPDLCRDIRAAGGLAIAAHPVSTRKFEKQTYHLWDRREELRDAFDAWEVASGPHLFEEVLRSGLPMVANSDMHLPKHMISWKTVLECERHPEAILEAIRRQELSFQFYRDPYALPVASAARDLARAPFPVP